jgi:hypothetical protein
MYRVVDDAVSTTPPCVVGSPSRMTFLIDTFPEILVCDAPESPQRIIASPHFREFQWHLKMPKAYHEAWRGCARRVFTCRKIGLFAFPSQVRMAMRWCTIRRL